MIIKKNKHDIKISNKDYNIIKNFKFNKLWIHFNYIDILNINEYSLLINKDHDNYLTDNLIYKTTLNYLNTNTIIKDLKNSFINMNNIYYGISNYEIL